MKTFVIDGNNFSNYREFCKEFSNTVFAGYYHEWTGNLDAFNDYLFGQPYTLVWRNFTKSREDLSYPETVKHLNKRLANCHPSNRPRVRAELKNAESSIGPTILDWILEIIAKHDNIVLILE